MEARHPPIASLLYPSGAGVPLGGPAPYDHDLGMTAIVRELDFGSRHSRFIAGLLSELQTDPAMISYRQGVLQDVLADEALATAIAAIMPQLRQVADPPPAQHWGDDVPLLQVASRLAELDCYVGCIEGLSAALEASAALRSAGLRGLRERLAALRSDPEHARLADELPELRSRIEQAGSVTIGVNLDPQLRPESATIISINGGRFAGKGSFVERLLGERGAAETVRGVTALYKADERQPHTPAHDLFRDLNRLLERVAAPVGEALARYTRLNTGRLAALEPELSFYLGAARLVRRVAAAGLPLCWPEIAPVGERVCRVVAGYSLDLALRLSREGTSIVTNDVALEPGAEIGVITGPNSGGKTTYARAVAQAHILMQAGLAVPGVSARISPVDAIHTHFPAAERPEQMGGRLAEELREVARIFARATGDSLIVINEPFTSTDHESARSIASDVLAGLRLLGARALLVTHIRELAADALLEEDGAGVASLVAGVEERDDRFERPVPSFRIERGTPESLRNATELARSFGLSRAQIEQLLRSRGLTDGARAVAQHQNGLDDVS